MSQQKAASPEDIYAVLSEDEIFSSLIGQYQFKSGSETISSISILSPNESLPQLNKQTGIEVVIHDVGEVRRMDYLTDVSEAIITWKVYLIAWPPSNGSNITAAISRMIEIFSNATAIDIVTTPNEIGALVQSLVLIPSNSSIMI